MKLHLHMSFGIEIIMSRYKNGQSICICRWSRTFEGDNKKHPKVEIDTHMQEDNDIRVRVIQCLHIHIIYFSENNGKSIAKMFILDISMHT